MCYKKTALVNAYQSGVRRCPCCNVQLVWKSNIDKPQVNLATIDHIVPKSIGGANTVDNMFVMCRKCNCDRGNKCFVEFVTGRGVSKIEAEKLYKNAHLVSVRGILYNMMVQMQTTAHRKMYVGQIKQVVKNYRKYFNDYLPEFDLLPREVCK